MSCEVMTLHSALVLRSRNLAARTKLVFRFSLARDVMLQLRDLCISV